MARRIILDTDIGDDIDDAYALAFALRAPELDLVAVLTTGGAVVERARIAREVIRRAGAEVPVFAGVDAREATVGHRMSAADGGPVARLDSSLDAVRGLVAEGPGTLVSIGGLTNVAYLLERLGPAEKDGLDIVAMGGSFARDYHGGPEPVAETNIRRDVCAARRVLTADVPLTLVPLDCTWDVALTEPHVDRIHSAAEPLGAALSELYGQWRREYGFPCPVMHDPLAVAVALADSPVRAELRRVRIGSGGRTRFAADGAPCEIAVERDRDAFLERFERALLRPRTAAPAGSGR